MKSSATPAVLAQPDAHCRKCNLWRGKRTVCVAGRGPCVVDGVVTPPIDVLLVGEAPGENEDREGQAFVGKAGGLLNAFLEHYLCGYRWHLSNTVRCQPPRSPNGKQTHPDAASMQACKGYLEDEVRYLKPKWIIALGQYAASAVFGTAVNATKVESLVGFASASRWGVKATVLHHPAWVLYGGVDNSGDGANVPAWEGEWQIALKLMKNEPLTVGGKWEYVTERSALEAKYELLRASMGPLVLDFETTGLSPWKDKFRMVGWAESATEAWVHPLYEPWQQGLLTRFLRECKTEIVVHHALFDVTWALVKLGVWPSTVTDTKALSFLQNENSNHNLEALTSLYVPEYRGYKLTTKGKVTDATDEQLSERCACDCMATFKLKQALWGLLSPKQQKLYGEVIGPALVVLAKCKQRGWKIDRAKLMQVRDESLKRIDELDAQIGTEAAKVGMPDFNPNSSRQLPILLHALGIDDPEARRQPNAPHLISTNKKQLERMVAKDPIVPAILELRAAKTRTGTFYQPFLNESWSDGYTHPNYNWGGRANPKDPAGTVTGRVSCSKPNLMNIPRKGPMKQAVVSRFVGGEIWTVDFKALELRIAAALANEEELIRVFREGGDPHQLTANKLTALLKRLIERDTGKTSNFGLLYGAGAAQFAWITGMPVPLADEVRTAWWASYPALDAYMAGLRTLAEKEARIEGVWGQVVHCPDAQAGDSEERDHALKRAGNFPVQNAGAILTLYAMVGVEREMEQREMESLLIGQVHDSLVLDVAPLEGEEIEPILYRCMVTDAMAACADWLTVPLDIDIKKGKTMAGDPTSCVGAPAQRPNPCS